MKLKIANLLNLYDEKDKSKSKSKHISAITGLIGEPLGIALLSHYFKSQNFEVSVICKAPKKEGNKGPRLDCWLAVEDKDGKNMKRIYQVEIKNWSAHSKGGNAMKIVGECNNHAIVETNNFNQIFKLSFSHTDRFEIINPRVEKVLIKMIKPDNYNAYNHLALACFWFPLNLNKHPHHFFEININNDNESVFNKLTVFSMSSYLRSLGIVGSIEVEMPLVEERMELIKCLFE